MKTPRRFGAVSCRLVEAAGITFYIRRQRKGRIRGADAPSDAPAHSSFEVAPLRRLGFRGREVERQHFPSGLDVIRADNEFSDNDGRVLRRENNNRRSEHLITTSVYRRYGLVVQPAAPVWRRFNHPGFV